MSSFIYHSIRVLPEGENRTLHHCSYLLSAFTALLYLLLGLASPPELRAQCGDGAHDFCQDSCCLTDVLLLNTGYDHAAGGVYPIGAQDAYWSIIQAPVGPLPRPASVILAQPGWLVPIQNTQWINGNANGTPIRGRVTYQKCFCVCSPEGSDFTFTLNLITAGNVKITVDGAQVAIIPNVNPNVTTPVTFTVQLSTGRHCLAIEVDNTATTQLRGLDIQGIVEGDGLLKYNCCGAASSPDPADPCLTDHVQLATDNTWTLVSGPATTGTYPRCASNISPVPGAWAPPIGGTNWIGQNTGGGSGPWHPGFDLYVYRKSFCVEEAGTFLITITSAADDSGAIFLNGLYLGNTGPYSGQTTQTFIVALEEGCNCLEFNVLDLGFAITGLNALVDIQGGSLRTPQCCDCGSCGAAPPPPIHRGEEHQGLSATPNTPDIEMSARPTLVSIPNPATGETVAHYMLDKETSARLELYDMAGKRVMVVDEGVQARGQHAVPILTKGLPAGAYRLQLIYGENTLSIPLNVQ